MESVDMLRNPLKDGDPVFAHFSRTPPPLAQRAMKRKST